MQLRRPEGLVHRNPDGVELVIACHLLGEGVAAVVIENDEVADEREKAVGLKNTLQHHLKLGHARVCQSLTGDGAPGLEPLPAGGQRADAGLGPVRDHQRLFIENRVGSSDLYVCNCCHAVQMVASSSAGFLSSMTPRGRPLTKEHHIRPAGTLILPDGELVDGQPVVVGRFVEIKDQNMVSANSSTSLPVLDFDAVY